MRRTWTIGAVAVALAGAGVAAVSTGTGRELAAPPPAADELAAPARSRIGANLTSINWYANERAFSNLVLGGFWQFASPTKGWSNLEPPFVTADGTLTALPPGGEAVRMLTAPDTSAKGALIRCSYAGKGELTARGSATQVSARPGEVTFRWINQWKNNVVWLQVHSVDPAAPIRQLDCREANAARGTRFDPGFVASLQKYAVLRYMGWELTNANAPAHWVDRHTPASIDVTTGSGVAAEDIVALSKAVGADAWVTTPWNADDDYVAHFARLLHEGMPADRAVYVEVGNEVWNNGFPVARQALAEGQARRLGQNLRETQMRRYAQRTIEVMRIWERIFADNPKRLVRIVSTQHVVPAAAEIVLAYPGLAEHVDALATAPYFGYDLQAAGATRDLGEVFRRLDAAADVTIRQAQADKAVAFLHGKRYLAYEAGQHVVLPADVPLLEQIERDPRMYQTYRRYIEAWRVKVGDTLMLFATTGGIGPGGAWGMAEHSGQSPTDAPKLRASIEARAAARSN